MVRALLTAVAVLWASFAGAQGTLPIVLQQQFSTVGCSTTSGACSTPLIAGQLYTYYVGTVATPQPTYQDSGLTLLNPFPLTLDASGRVPAFYLASGSVHVRLTDSGGVVQFDVPSMLVIGGSGGGTSPSGIDPTTILSTGDIKFRATAETLTGWVRLNGLTVGSALSGATERANSDTQNLFTYLWTNCAQPTTNAHCPVVGGIGASAAADFAANKQITLMDWRGRLGVGLDTMGNSAAGRLLASQVTSGGGDTVTTPNATGGASTTVIAQANLAPFNFTVTDPGHSHTSVGNFQGNALSGSGLSVNSAAASTGNSTTGISVASGGSGTGANTISPFMLGTYFVKL